jgi:hypothetical protein
MRRRFRDGTRIVQALESSSHKPSAAGSRRHFSRCHLAPACAPRRESSIAGADKPHALESFHAHTPKARRSKSTHELGPNKKRAADICARPV